MELQGNPWLLYPGDKNLTIFSGRAFIKSVVFGEYATQTDRLRIVDEKGLDVVTCEGSTDLGPVEIQLGSSTGYKGLRLAELDSGRAYLYME